MIRDILYALSVLIAGTGISCGQFLINPYQFAAGGGGGGGPTLIASDNFDSYTSASSLDAAANWVVESGTLNIANPSGDGSVISGAGATGLARHTGTFAANQRTEVTLDGLTGSASYEWVGAAVRVQTGAATGYLVVAGSTDLFLLSLNAGTAATINSDTGMTLSAGHKIAIECSGTGAAGRLKVQIDTGSGWVDKWTNQDPAVDIDGGSCGVASYLFSSFTAKVDDFFGYDL